MKTESKLRVQIRWLIRRDMDRVLDIEGESFAVPWGEEDFLDHLRKKNCIGMVAERDKRIVGYMVYEMHHGELRLLNMAVDPDFRRLGVAAQMVQKIKGKLSQQRRKSITIMLGDDNLSGQLFFQSQDFWCDATMPGYFNGQDGYHMFFQLPSELTGEQPEWE